MTDKTPFYKLPLVEYAGRTATGRFPSQPEFQDLQPYQRHTLEGLEGIGRREGRRVEYVKAPAASVLAQMDYAKLEARIMAQVADSMGLERIDHETFACKEPADFKRIGEVLQDAMTNVTAFWYATVAVERFFTDIDEEGCGAVFAALKSWED